MKRLPALDSRRRFLAALGATFVPAFHSTAFGAEAVAPGRKPPLRFIGVYTPHGSAYELWRPGADFDLRYDGCSLQPFDDEARFGRSFRQNLLVLDGLDLASGIQAGTVGHDAARVILTGASAGRGGASLDQFLAVDKLLGAETPETSLVLSVGNDNPEIGSCISYGALGNPVPKIIDPTQLFDNLFGRSLTNKGAAELAALRVQGRSSLDFVRQDLATLRARASGNSRAQLQQHEEGLREIEKHLTPSTRQCATPTPPNSAEFRQLRAHGGGEPYFERVTQLMTQLLVRAFACDLTRFATFMLADLSHTRIYPNYPADVHFGVAHRYIARDNAGGGDAATWRALALQNHHSYGQVAYLLQCLAEAGVLDETLVLVASDMGDVSRHSSRNVPMLLAGGAHTGFRFGRHLDFRATKKQELLPHNRLLVSLLAPFGVEQDSFGNSASSYITNGRLAEL